LNLYDYKLNHFFGLNLLRKENNLMCLQFGPLMFIQQVRISHNRLKAFIHHSPIFYFNGFAASLYRTKLLEMRRSILSFIVALNFVSIYHDSMAQTHSIARQWNAIVLEAIRNDFARPTVHARNLFHHSIICYDAWAAYNPSKETYFLGQTKYGYTCAFDSLALPGDIATARIQAISYASYRFLENRYSNSPDYPATLLLANNLMNTLGLDPSYTSTDYQNEGAAALGNYLAQEIQQYGYTDGSNEANDFANQYYVQLNPPLEMAMPGNPDIQDPNHWQPLVLETLIDQSGNLITTTQPHLSPEWGDVHPFALDTAEAIQLSRDGITFNVYFDTMQPALLNSGDSAAWDSFYKWNHTLVSVWQSHLDPNDSVMWDISPASIGNNTWYPNPNNASDYPLFYDLINGGDPGVGHALNPVTGQPYEPQIVPRADYARVLAEFWADGIDSETPPGHWYEIYHYVTDHPLFERRWKGMGPVLDPLEYDVKAHLALGGTVHDAAIAAWSLKGYYDYLRPVSAIRHMADLGQSSDTSALSYHPDGIPLLSGYVELVLPGDSLAGQWNENVGKVKLYTWRGHDYITDPLTDIAEVGWILAENWWPYQRPTFVTPPFAGFVSGHSTFSRAAAHTMAFMTGSDYFPGGLGEFVAPMNEYLKFEEGPSDTVVLQWATYIDAADQCSLSRLWGGIHPPIDDIPGRIIGDVIGPQASILADSIYAITNAALVWSATSDSMVTISDIGATVNLEFGFSAPMDTSIAPSFSPLTTGLSSAVGVQQSTWVDSTHFLLTLDVLPSSLEMDEVKFELIGCVTGSAQVLPTYSFKNVFLVDTKAPTLLAQVSNSPVVNDSSTVNGVVLELVFSEACNTSAVPGIAFSAANYGNPTLTFMAGASSWLNDSVFEAHFSVIDFNERIDTLDLSVFNSFDKHGNPLDSVVVSAPFFIDTENPQIIQAYPSDLLINQQDLTSPSKFIDVTFSEPMSASLGAIAEMEHNGNVFNALQFNSSGTNWLTSDSLRLNFLVYQGSNDLIPLDLVVLNLKDSSGNSLESNVQSTVLWSDLKAPAVLNAIPNRTMINDSLVGSNNYFIDINFDEPMDTSTVPSVMHQAAPSINGSIQYNVTQSHYVDSATYRAYFQVWDENIEVSTIDLAVGFAKDASGNAMAAHSESGFVALDTKNPSVVGLYANTSVLNQWGQSWDVMAVYDEAMRQNINPVVQLSPLSVSFPLVSNSWLNAINYNFQHELLGVPAQVMHVDLMLEGATDIAGNIQLPVNANNFVQIEPLLGIDEQTTETVLLFPNPASLGDRIAISGLTNLGSELEMRCFNSLGQELPVLKFTLEGGIYLSHQIELSAGWYLLKYNNQQVKLLVH
jgi:hypothetical protein